MSSLRPISFIGSQAFMVCSGFGCRRNRLNQKTLHRSNISFNWPYLLVIALTAAAQVATEACAIKAP
jgi:hypothetical protein